MKKCLEKKTRIALFLLAALLFTALFAAFPVSASAGEAETEDYDSYYVEGWKVKWDAFGGTNTHTASEIFGDGVGTLGEGYLSVNNAALDFSALFANDGATDYTLDLTVAMQGAPYTSASMSLGALWNFGVQINHAPAAKSHPIDSSYGIISGTYRALRSSAGKTVEIATDVSWKQIRFLGKPLGEVYTFAVSTDYDVANSTALLTLWRDGAKASVDSTVAEYSLTYPITDSSGNVLDSDKFQFSNRLNYDYYALRYYEKALTAEELQKNHFIDLAKWFGISLDVYDSYDENTREALHLALREESFDTLTKSALQSIVDSFGTHATVVDIEDYITFEGFSAALTGAPGLRSVYTVDLNALKALEKDGYAVTVGALVAVEDGRDIAEIDLALAATPQSKAVAREVYADGAINNTVIESSEDAFRFALTTRYDSTASEAYYQEKLLYRAFMTVSKNGKSETLYLDAEGDTFGNSVTVKEVSALLAFLGKFESTPIKRVLGEDLISLAEVMSASYAEIYRTRQNGEALSENVNDYLFSVYQLYQDIMAETGEKTSNSVTTYTYANASPYYKLFDSTGAPHDQASYDTLVYMLQCKNAFANVLYAADRTTELYNKALAEQTLYRSKSTVLAAIKSEASTLGISTEESAFITDLLEASVAAHEKALADIARDMASVQNKLQSIKSAIATPVNVIDALYAEYHTKNDLPVFGTDTPLSSYVILSDPQNEAAAKTLSSILSDKYGVFVPYYTSFPATASYAHVISLFDATDADAALLLGDNDYLLSMQGTNALIVGSDPSNTLLGAVTFTRELTENSFILKEQTAKDVPDLFNTDLPTYLPALTVKAVEDGGVLERFYMALEELPEELTVVEPLSSADYPLSTVNTVYVSPNGDDQNNGTYFSPFKTIERALAYAVGKGGAQILLFGGTYQIDRTLTLSALHSGSKQSPLYISAMPGEDVIFTSSKAIDTSSFKSIDDAITAGLIDSSIKTRLNTFSANNSKNVYVIELDPATHPYGKPVRATSYDKGSTQITPESANQLYLNGELLHVARWPNAGVEDTANGIDNGRIKFTDKGTSVDKNEEDVLKVGKVTTATSSLYAAHWNETTSWQIVFDNCLYRDHLLAYDKSVELYTYAAVFEEWHRDHYRLTLSTDSSGRNIMTSDTLCSYGAMEKAGNNMYFYNALEDLDTDQEYFLDDENGLLYLYSDTPMKNKELRISSSSINLLDITGASNVVLNRITFTETLGYGLLVSDSENVLIQNCTFRNIGSNACRIENSYNSGVIGSDFSRTSDTMLMIAGRNDRATMTPDRIFVQNCYFHDPIVQNAINLNGISCLVSHNLFEHTTVFWSGAECILEYNDFDSGSQITYDSGPIYVAGATNPKGNHIRYNYLYNLNYSRYGIYLDDLCSDNYVYSNVVVNADYLPDGITPQSSTKGVNIHGGHQNVVYNNVLVNAKDAAIRDNANYYMQYVLDKTGENVVETGTNHPNSSTSGNTYRYYYKTLSDGTQSFGKSAKPQTSGGLGYRWDSIMTNALNAFDKAGGSDARYAERFPNLAIYMELTRKQLELSHADTNYKWGSAKVDWNLTPKSGTAYAWGDQSLRDFLMSHVSTQDIEVYLRSPAYNEYIGNVFIGSGDADIFLYTPWGMNTTSVENNYGFTRNTEYFTRAMNAMNNPEDLAYITSADTWKGYVEGFTDIPYERFGRTELSDVDIYTPRIKIAEDYDLTHDFDNLLNGK